MRLSVIVVNWNGRDWIGQCLDSIPPAVLDLPAEVIVVDNQSTDSSVSYIRENFPDVEVFESGENLGFGRGAQAGVTRASGEYLVVANPDIAFTPRSLVRLVRFLEEHQSAAWVGPKIVGPDGKVQSQALPLAGVFEPLRWVPGLAWLVTPLSARRHDGQRRCERLYGACMVFRASMLQAIGGMPAAAFLGGEEQRLGAAFRERGYEVWYDPFATVFHEPSTARRARWPADKGIIAMVAGMNGAMRETLTFPRLVGYLSVICGFSALWFLKGLLRGRYRGRQSLEIAAMALREARSGRSGER